MKQILALVNPKSGPDGPHAYIDAVAETWDTPENELYFQFSQSEEDGADKIQRAIDRGVDTVIVIGGDGMVNSIGSQLLHTDVALAVIPAGSGNGFARHFNIPLEPDEAAEALLNGRAMCIDVGKIDDRYFLSTCSMAWDGALVETFEKFPFRGIVPYVLAGAKQLLEYKAQPIQVDIDGKAFTFDHPLVFTVANLSQFGSDVVVAPEAKADSGELEFVTVEQKDMPKLITHMQSVTDHTFTDLPYVTNQRFRKMTVRRENNTPIQIDGESLDIGKEAKIEIVSQALRIIVPKETA
ncbi:YegS/Rv2252/BmrU family lipid kinase [Pontiellaceae bacterium B1224]|nr:YegS/Rv2252/BmrU family lipid kinase [Pontiellaceae bacterium B1224]